MAASGAFNCFGGRDQRTELHNQLNRKQIFQFPTGLFHARAAGARCRLTACRRLHIHVRGVGHCLRRILRTFTGSHHRKVGYSRRCGRRYVHGGRRQRSRALHQRHRCVYFVRQRGHRNHCRVSGLQRTVCYRHVCHVQQDRADVDVVAALPRLHLLQHKPPHSRLLLRR